MNLLIFPCSFNKLCFVYFKAISLNTYYLNFFLCFPNELKLLLTAPKHNENENLQVHTATWINLKDSTEENMQITEEHT